MDLYKYAGIIIAIAMVVFSLLTVVSFCYCMYVTYQGNWDQSTNEVANKTERSDKTKGHSNPTELETWQEEHWKNKKYSTCILIFSNLLYNLNYDLSIILIISDGLSFIDIQYDFVFWTAQHKKYLMMISNDDSYCTLFSYALYDDWLLFSTLEILIKSKKHYFYFKP